MMERRREDEMATTVPEPGMATPMGSAQPPYVEVPTRHQPPLAYNLGPTRP